MTGILLGGGVCPSMGPESEPVRREVNWQACAKRESGRKNSTARCALASVDCEVLFSRQWRMTRNVPMNQSEIAHCSRRSVGFSELCSGN
jgi:hypothetical protein